MQRWFYLLSMVVSASFLLFACSGQNNVDEAALETVVTLTAEARLTQTVQPTSAPTLPPQATPTSMDQQQSLIPPERLTVLFGSEVQNPQGETLGTADDFLLDLASNDIPFIVLHSGGILGIGEKQVPIPWAAFEVDFLGDEENRPIFLLDFPQEIIAQAPNLEIGEEVDLTAEDWQAVYNVYWAEHLSDGVQSSPIPGENEEAPGIYITGRRLVDLPVIIRAGNEEIGQIQEVLLNPVHGGIQYLVVSAGGILGVGEKWIPAPPVIFQLNTDPLALSLLVEQERLTDAPNYDLAYLPETTNRNWDREIQEYWQVEQ